MVRLRRRRVVTSAITTVAIALTTVMPFCPGALEFIRRGVPDLVSGGDAAALELGTWHAAHGQQLLGPYSRFGWNHPGPLFFYLALPIYVAFGRRAAALNLFAFVTDFVCAASVVTTLTRSGGRVVGLVVSVLVGVFELQALPYLLGNEWNPILPILPFVLLCVLSARISTGATALLPWFAFISSAIIQTHVAYAPAVCGLAVYVLARLRSSNIDRQFSRTTVMMTTAVLVVCWTLPLVEAATASPGNLQRLVAFFVPTPRHMSQQSWPAALDAFSFNVALLPLSVIEIIRASPLPRPGALAAACVTLALLIGVLYVWHRSSRRRDDSTKVFAEIVGVVSLASLLAIRGIRGELLFYLVSWCAAIGLLALISIARSFLRTVDDRIGEVTLSVTAAAASCAFALYLLTTPAMHRSVIGIANPDVERLAPAVNRFVTERLSDVPVIHIDSESAWPVAVGVVLYLRKHGTSVAVEDRWLHVVGRPLMSRPGSHSRLIFVDDSSVSQLRERRTLREVASAHGVNVFFTASAGP